MKLMIDVPITEPRLVRVTPVVNDTRVWDLRRCQYVSGELVVDVQITAVAPPSCPNCGETGDATHGGWCQKCDSLWPGDPVRCQCDDCKSLYTRGAPWESDRQCPSCYEFCRRGRGHVTVD